MKDPPRSLVNTMFVWPQVLFSATAPCNTAFSDMYFSMMAPVQHTRTVTVESFCTQVNTMFFWSKCPEGSLNATLSPFERSTPRNSTQRRPPESRWGPKPTKTKELFCSRLYPSSGDSKTHASSTSFTFFLSDTKKPVLNVCVTHFDASFARVHRRQQTTMTPGLNV